MRDLILEGIIQGSLAYTGPEIVQFDVTNRCNNNCLCCWNNSPLIGLENEKQLQEKKQEMPIDLIIRTIETLRCMGTKILFFAGGGEPFMHPSMIEVLKCAKKNKMKVFMNTNFTLIGRESVEHLVNLKIDHIHVSLLAGTALTYSIIHPNKTQETFYDIKERLKYTASLKKERNQHLYNPLPHINLYYVISNKNYHEIKEMVDLAIEVKADTVEFTPIDIVPGKTDCLLLNNEQIKRVKDDIEIQLKRLNKYNENEPVKTNIEQCNNFLKRISSPAASIGKYESETITKQPCYVGWTFVRIKADGDVNPCLKAHRISVGNIYKKDFEQIWNSEQQQIFRIRSFSLDFSNPYFSNIGNDPDLSLGCLKSCDNIQINTDMHGRYCSLLKEYGRI